MGIRKTGKYGKVYIPLSAGIVSTDTLLVKSASKTIGGTAYANRFWGTSASSYWNRQQGITVRIEGVIGSPTITPAAAGGDNNVDVAAFSYYAAGTTVATSTAKTDLTLTRPASGKYNWNLIHVNKTTGAVTATTGTDGDAYSDTFAAAGGPPLVATTELIIGAVKWSSDTAAAVLASEIYYTLSDGTLIQERSDVPAYTIFPMEGGILLNEALIVAHTGSVPRSVYATFYDQYNLMQEIGDTESWTLNMTTPTTELPAQNDIAAQFDIGTSSATGTLKRFHVDERTWELVAQQKTGFLRLYPDSTDTTKYFECAAVFSDFSVTVDQGAAMSEDISFSVDGLVELRGY